MSAKFRNTKFVYSTNPDFDQWDEQDDKVITLSAENQKLYVTLDMKQRRGKKVTLVTGYVGRNEDLKELGKILKSKCGVGGSVKDNEILIQGDFKEKVKDLLVNMGYSCKIKG
ncbi:MAG TPA: translation initiation factor [Bacteroidales bacterium]|jgi:translation initiation factor 1|nr:translation initiation factor [Bacteroidota bacterium]HJN05219.1 translation initiation factor [Bacteroidales bacterium]|tara:strand:+ start:880 stop:1218 length:339 start_codon:yes stop_codon:yes gene_type:complete